MHSTPISEGRLPSKRIPFLGLCVVAHLATLKVVPARYRQQLASAARYSKAASTRGGTFRHVLPLNSAAHADARGRAAIHPRRRARAGGCERWAAI